MSARLVSVVVPTQDRPELLRQALSSIRALSGPDLEFEILVGDNGKLPETRSVALEYGARHFKTERAGAGAARNVALGAATGEFVAFLDDDDLWLGEHVRGHLKLLDADPDMEAVVGQVTCTDVDRRPTGPSWPWYLPPDGAIFLDMLSGYFPQIGATVVRTRVRDTLGGFDESLMADQDWDWHLRIAKHHKIGFVQRPCVLFRQRPPGTSDALQLRRMPYTRRVFLRHALGTSRLWRSPIALLLLYNRALGGYATYFAEAALLRANEGQPGVVRSIANAFRASPLVAGRLLLTDSPLRKATLAVLSPDRRG